MLIKLTQNQYTIIDDKDFDLVSKYKWQADFDKKLGKHYVKTTIRVDGKRKSIRLHRLVTGAKTGEVVDHINSNPLDNRVSNLRVCTISENAKNRSLNKNNTSGFKGVVWHSQAKKWQSKIYVNGRWKSQGLYLDKIEAALAYNIAAIKHFGQFAKLNIVSSNN